MLIEDKLYQKIYTKLNKNIIEITNSKRTIVNEAVKDLVEGGGKKLRPFLMFLAASFGDDYDKDKLIQLGSGIELLHMASLVHDDIIDDADLRRGKESAQKKFGKKEAVFIGDFLLSKTFDIFFDYLDRDVLKKMNKHLRLLCEGEIEQSEKRYELQIGVRDYYRRIRHKTALLFALSSYLGGYVSGIRGKKLNILYKLGLEIGMAFQIQDDLLDFEGDENNTGKVLARDLKEGIVTLPVILLMGKNEYNDKYQIYNKNVLDESVVNDIITDVKESDVLKESREILLVFIKRVEKYMDRLPNNRAKKKLKKLIELQVDRKF
ncbi:polyprenyl synthetase family protein [Halanaerobium congolense]|uniref:Heptaprenyl diphosphate synthase n=1 Tax=Halanaerobium congolense TaxID=54121 RepID=A0A1G6QRP2_9FIRM|nr:polyprenyl synthetase family protein [Halanaerobium congolense]PUU87681.1 MAG: heptaprenyl diphosphate synthase [Halanaerobium sp.]PTX16753.1 heptaprenyl diphosphate synthase [Halanaerobium congolense]TDP06519.1 heptaprenyl diphosphate synthase [Halanaerobium congolense]TDX47970.1 heptaprenyl diphosphate synthase [Halanaerobium congolense]SDC95020.1 heptaprenyl diphosphate synthase [Halanaerobium congolense]